MIDWTPIALPAGLSGTLEYKLENDGLVRWRGKPVLTLVGPAVVVIPALLTPIYSPMYFDWTSFTTDLNASAIGTNLTIGAWNLVGYEADMSKVSWYAAPPAVAVGGSFQYSVAGLLLGQGTPYMVSNLAGLKSHSPRATFPSRPQAHGTMPVPGYLNEKQVIIPISFPDFSFRPAQELGVLLDAVESAWAPTLDADTLQTFYYLLPGQEARVLFGRTGRIDVNMETYDLGWLDATLEFRATDPISYSATASGIGIALGNPTVGRSYNRVYPKAYGAATSGASTLVNSGNTITYPIITFTGPITNPTAENITTGQKLVFNIALLAGDVLVVDVKERTVTLNGTASRYNTLVSPADQWWGLVPGNNSVRYGAANYVAGSLMNVSWRSAFL